jgi:sugar-specific transcriptional regulator TrmB
MVEIPSHLIAALKELGLLESEANIYAALVLLHDAEVKELQDLLDLSKPSIYEGLRALENKGFIILTNPRPATYQAIPPDVALDMRVTAQIKAKDAAIDSLAKLRDEKSAKISHSDLWYVFGQKHFESKIKEMLKNARKSIFCITSQNYLGFFEQGIRSKTDVELIVISDGAIDRKRLDELSLKGRLRVRTVRASDLVRTAMEKPSGNRSKGDSSVDVRVDEQDYENMLLLIVDDSEMLFIPSITGTSSNAINMKNEALVQRIKPTIAEWFIGLGEGDAH